MMAEQIVYHVLDALEALGVPHMVVGSFSSNLYGLPRSTRDADFVVELGDVPVSRLAQQLGPGFRLDPQMSFETITGTYRFIASHVASAFRVEFFLLSDDPHDRERFARRRRAAFPEREGFVATPEDVVITKLRWSKGGSRPKDIEDVRNVIIGQKSRLDWGYIRRWCAAHGTTELLEKVRREAEAD
jgi:hypothetical protein